MLKTEAAEHYHTQRALSQTDLFVQVFCKAVIENKTCRIFKSDFEEFGT